MQTHRGGCHCGNISMAFSTSIDPHDTEIRACQCSFCRRHGSVAASDPNGKLVVSITRPQRLLRYTFGLRTADYLVCAGCGVYVAAVTRDEERPRAIVIVNALDDRALFDREPKPMDYGAESKDERIARRRARWMPVDVVEDAEAVEAP